MATGATAVSIASNALQRLGGATIASFDEAKDDGANLQQVRLAASLWPTVRQAMLRAHPWNCATTRVLLSPDATPPAFGFARRFMQPTDWLRTLQVGDDEANPLVYRTEGRYFLSDEAALPLVYIADNQAPATYDAILLDVMELAMAQAMAYPVTKSTSLRDDLSAELEKMLRTARTVDGQDDPPETLGGSLLYAARFGGSIA